MVKKFSTDDSLTELIEIYDKVMPEKVCLMKNPERYHVVANAVSKIGKMAISHDKDSKIEITRDDLTGSSVCMSIITDLFVVEDINGFCDALREANTFEANPRTDGKIQIGLVFEDVWRPAPPSSKK